MSVAWQGKPQPSRQDAAESTARHRVTRSVQYFPYTDLTACCQERKKIRRWSFTPTAIQLLAMARGAERLQRRQRPRPYCRTKDPAHRGQRSDDARPTVRTQY